MSHALPHSINDNTTHSNVYAFYPAHDPFGLSGIAPGQQDGQHYGSPSSPFHPSAANPAYASPHVHATGHQQFQTPQQQSLFQRQAQQWQPTHACMGAKSAKVQTCNPHFEPPDSNVQELVSYYSHVQCVRTRLTIAAACPIRSQCARNCAPPPVCFRRMSQQGGVLVAVYRALSGVSRRSAKRPAADSVSRIRVT